MEELLEELYHKYKRICEYPDEIHRISCNSGNLKKGFTREQKKLLLRIIDDMDWIAEADAVSAFKDGVRFGVKLITEIFSGI